MTEPKPVPNHSIYIHIPFCKQRCTYCDFNTVAGHSDLIPEYVEALCTEIVKVSKLSGSSLPVHTIFFGGGTPTLLSPPQLKKIIATLNHQFTILPNAEITMEGNPGTVTQQDLTAYHTLGINRLSFGVQSVHASELKVLGRIHDHQTTVESISQARKAGFDNLNLDLIFGLPYQTLKSWQQTLDTIIALSPDHLSLYALKLEQGTALRRSVESGKIPRPDDDLAADMFEYVQKFLPTQNFQHYEISNWAQKTETGFKSSRHNLQYWLNQPYFGFGAGAHGLINNSRIINEYDIATYIRACQTEISIEYPLGPATVDYHHRSHTEALEDEIILALRLTHAGLNIEQTNQKFSINFTTRYKDQIKKLESLKLIEWLQDKTILRLTQKGCLLGNQVFQEFLED